MGKIDDVVKALECCQTMDGCSKCQRPDKGIMECTMGLARDALEVIRELQEKQTSVGSESKPLENPCVGAGEGSAAAYWHGYADALKWAFSDRFEGMAASEVPDNV